MSELWVQSMQYLTLDFSTFITIIVTIMPIAAQTFPSTVSVSAMELRSNPGSILDRVFYRNESIVVKRAGKPKAALVPLSLLRVVEQARARVFSTNTRIQRAFASESPREVADQIRRAIRSVRHGHP